MSTKSVKEFVNPKRIEKGLKRLEKNKGNLEKCGFIFRYILRTIFNYIIRHNINI